MSPHKPYPGVLSSRSWRLTGTLYRDAIMSPHCCSAGTWYLTVSGERIPNSLFALSGGTFALPYSPMECLSWAAQQPAQARIDSPQMTHLLSVLSTLAYEDARIIQDVITHR